MFRRGPDWLDVGWGAGTQRPTDYCQTVGFILTVSKAVSIEIYRYICRSEQFCIILLHRLIGTDLPPSFVYSIEYSHLYTSRLTHSILSDCSLDPFTTAYSSLGRPLYT